MEEIWRYADRARRQFGAADTPVISYTGLWLLLALVAPAADAITEALGLPPEDARETAEKLIAEAHPTIAAALGAWLADWVEPTTPLPVAVDPLPDQETFPHVRIASAVPSVGETNVAVVGMEPPGDGVPMLPFLRRSGRPTGSRRWASRLLAPCARRRPFDEVEPSSVADNLLCVDAACRKTRDRMSIPKHQTRATYDAETITVYQAYSPAIADPAVAAGTFAPPFSLTRMTWVKPSFLWMMYRCGWATKAGQERVLAVRITRAGFESALSQACLSHFDRDHHTDRDAWRDALRRSPVRIQWDPERTPSGAPLPYRSLQIGLGPEVVPAYVDDWIVGIDDVTNQLPAIRSGEQPCPTEKPYSLPTDIAARIGASS